MPTVLLLAPAAVCALSWFGIGTLLPRRVLPEKQLRAILGGAGSEPAPIQGCLRRTAVYHARFVTSRSLGQGIPYNFVLYSLLRCQR